VQAISGSRPDWRAARYTTVAMLMRSTALTFVAAALAAMLACGGDDRPTTPVAPTPTNRAPQISQAVPDQTLTLGDRETADIDLDLYFSDPDDDALTYEAASGDAQVAEARVSNNTVTLVARQAGRADVQVTARDPAGLSETQRFSVTVEPAAPPPNREPQITQAVPDQTLTLGEYERVNIDLDSHFTDPDGDALVYEVVSSNTHVAEARLSSSTLTLVASHLGRANIRVTARDPAGLTATERFSVTVEQGSPRAELEITLCQADGLGVVDVLVEGTVRAVTRLSSARVIAYVDAHRLGEQAVGNVPAGGARSFAIRGTAPVSSASECHVEFLAGQQSISLVAPVSFR